MNLDFIISHFIWLGPWFFFLGAIAEALPFIGTFMPGATIVTLGGFMSAHGYFSLPAVLFFSITGAAIGDTISYYAGLHGGNYIRNKKIINEPLLQKGEQFFKKYGNASILWGRFIGPIRSIIPFMAGMYKVKPAVFWLWNIVSAIIWGIFYVSMGYFSGSVFAAVVKRWNYKITLILISVIFLIIIIWLTKNHRQPIKQYFINQSAKFTIYVQNLRFIKQLGQRYPALNEFFTWQTYRLKLYFLVISLLILNLTFVLALIFDWL